MTAPKKTFQTKISEAKPGYRAEDAGRLSERIDASLRATRMEQAIERKQERDRGLVGTPPEVLWGEPGAALCADFLALMEINGYLKSTVVEHKIPYNGILHPEHKKHPLFPTPFSKERFRRFRTGADRAIKRTQKHDHHHKEQYDEISPDKLRAYPIGIVFQKKSAGVDIPEMIPSDKSTVWPHIKFSKAEDPSTPRTVYLCEDGAVRVGGVVNTTTRMLESLPIAGEDGRSIVRPFIGILTNSPARRIDHNEPLMSSYTPYEIASASLEDMLVRTALWALDPTNTALTEPSA
jgi:hypothetical protein